MFTLYARFSADCSTAYEVYAVRGSFVQIVDCQIMAIRCGASDTFIIQE